MDRKLIADSVLTCCFSSASIRSLHIQVKPSQNFKMKPQLINDKPIQLKMLLENCRDYDVLNHHMLLMLMERINGMQTQNKLSWDDSDSEVDWTSWIDTELSEDVEDPDFVLPEQVGENSITTASTSRRYNLRHRPIVK